MAPRGSPGRRSRCCWPLTAGGSLRARPAPTAASVQAYFLQGEQLVGLKRNGTTTGAAVTALLAGPTPGRARPEGQIVRPGRHTAPVGGRGERRRHHRPGRALRGRPRRRGARRAHRTARPTPLTSVPGVTSVRVLVDGRCAAGALPRPCVVQAGHARTCRSARGAAARAGADLGAEPRATTPARCSSSSPTSASCRPTRSTAWRASRRGSRSSPSRSGPGSAATGVGPQTRAALDRQRPRPARRAAAASRCCSTGSSCSSSTAGRSSAQSPSPAAPRPHRRRPAATACSARSSARGACRSASGCRGRRTSSAASRSTSTRTCRRSPPPTAVCGAALRREVAVRADADGHEGHRARELHVTRLRCSPSSCSSRPICAAPARAADRCPRSARHPRGRACRPGLPGRVGRRLGRRLRARPRGRPRPRARTAPRPPTSASSTADLPRHLRPGPKPWDLLSPRSPSRERRGRTVDFSAPYLQATRASSYAEPRARRRPRSARTLKLCAQRGTTGEDLFGACQPTRAPPGILAATCCSTRCEGRCDAAVSTRRSSPPSARPCRTVRPARRRAPDGRAVWRGPAQRLRATPGRHRGPRGAGRQRHGRQALAALADRRVEAARPALNP